MKVLAVIPARGGSKGIPKKNIQLVAGKPLIAYTILSAKRSRHINKIIVSTDDKKISDISHSYGAEIPFLRPKKFARDDSSTLNVIKHTLEHLEKNQLYIPDVVVILQPTSPLRTTKTIDSCINLLKKTNASSVLTVSEVKKHPFTSFWLKRGFLNPLNRKFPNYYQRQKYPNLYFPTGAVYAFWYKTLQKYGTIYGPRIKPLVVNDENAVDIDTPFDLFISEMVLIHWNKYKKRFY